MKLLLILYSGPSPKRVTSLFDSHGVSGWTEIDHAHGAGTTGRREGTRAWPGESSIFFTAIGDEPCHDFKAALREQQAGLGEGERLHVLSIPVDDFF
jgi:hypothetical protein